MTTYPCTGTCSRSVSFDIAPDGTLAACSFEGGCPGNTNGVAKLVVGRPAAEVAALLKGTPCGRRGTSCPDQLARAIESELAKRNPQGGFSYVIPVALLLAVAVFAFVVYRYQLVQHLPGISELPVKPDIPVFAAFPDAEPCVFPAADARPDLAPSPPGSGDVRWEASPSEVRAAEGIPPFRTSPTAIVYSLDVLNQPCMLTYFFRRERLYGVQFQFASPGSGFLPDLTPQQARKLYDRLKGQLDARYGDAVETTTSHPRSEGEGAAPADTVVTRLLSQWTSGPMAVTMVLDLSTPAPSLEIRYKATPARRGARG